MDWRRALIAGTVGVASLAPAAALGGPTSTRDLTPRPIAESIGDPSAAEHLAAIMAMSGGPEFRRYGSPGVAATADHIDEHLVAAGFSTRRLEPTLPQWVVDYSPDMAPSLTIHGDEAASFAVESGFARGYDARSPIDLSTGPAGVDCTVVAFADLADDASGTCPLVPFADASPEWNNVTAPSSSAFISQAAAAGAAGIIFQGLPERDMIFAQQTRTSLPVISAAVGDIVGRTATIRVNGAWDVDERMRNVVGVLHPTDPTAGYVALTAHIDSWFEGAVDNGTGTAAVLDAAEALGRRSAAGTLDVGVVAIFIDAEEIGLLGSRAVAEALETGLDVGERTITMDQIVANVNLDASSAKPSDVHGHDHSSPLATSGIPVFSWRALIYSDPYPATSSPQPYVEAVDLGTRFTAVFGAHEVHGLPVPSSPWTQASGGWRTDGQWFHEAGIPVIWPVAGYPEYHTNLDIYDASGSRYSTVDAVDLQHLADATVDWVLTQL